MKGKLLTVALAAVMLVGCSSSDDEPTKEPEQTYKVTKENIVGVWRNGEYWVSFSEDGYMSAYLTDKCITEGDYVIDKDTVKAESSLLYYCTKFLVNEINENTINCTISYCELERPSQERTNGFVFVKTGETPCPKDHELIGKKFQYDMDVVVSGTGAKRDTLLGIANGEVATYCFIDRHLWTENIHRDASTDYYVYRPPYIYYNDWYGYISRYNQSKEIINIREIRIKNDSIIIGKP